MYKIYSCFLLVLLGIIYVFSGTEENNQVARPVLPTNTKEPSDVLPLVLIKLVDYCYSPTKIDTVTWAEEGKIFSAGTQFSGNLEGDLVYMCAIERLLKEKKTNGKRKLITEPRDDNCLFEIQFDETDPLRCVDEPEPLIEKIIISKERGIREKISCGPGYHGKMYQFVYKICITDEPIPNKDILELEGYILEENRIKYRDNYKVYRFCYNDQNNEIIYTHHTINSPDLLFDGNLEHEQEKKYDYATNGYKLFRNHFKKIKEMYEKLNIFMGKNLPNETEPPTESTSTQLPYMGQQLVPADDMEFALLRKTTYHYINTKPMRAPYVKPWNYITKRIREDAIERNRKYELYTGVLTFPDRKGKSTQPALQIPDIWMKVLRHMYIANPNDDKHVDDVTAIIMNTNPSNEMADAFFKRNCQINLCQDVFAEKFIQVGKSIGCCRVTEEIRRFFNFNFVIHDNLDVEFLFVNDHELSDKMNE